MAEGGVQRRPLVALVVTSLVLTVLFTIPAGAAAAQEGQYTREEPAQESTAPDTTAQDAIDQAAREAQEAQQADNQQRDGSFQCVSFLRVVRDEQGNLRRQYLDDDLIVQRFEQCLEGEVLKSTIPDEDLPYTGGTSLFLLAGGALLITGLLVSRQVIKRSS
jgi:hypothetical protein